jgi:hypothetical protein
MQVNTYKSGYQLLSIILHYLYSIEIACSNTYGNVQNPKSILQVALSNRMLCLGILFVLGTENLGKLAFEANATLLRLGTLKIELTSSGFNAPRYSEK